MQHRTYSEKKITQRHSSVVAVTRYFAVPNFARALSRESNAGTANVSVPLIFPSGNRVEPALKAGDIKQKGLFLIYITYFKFFGVIRTRFFPFKKFFKPKFIHVLFLTTKKL